VLFPILRRVNEILALGYVTARVVECVFIAVGILSLLSPLLLSVLEPYPLAGEAKTKW
jgi:hypothetical protein